MAGIYGNCREDKYFEKLLHDYLDSTERCDDCESHIDDCECDTEKEEYAESENQETELEKAGYAISASLTSKVTLLVNESGIESAKTKKARDSGITIITNLKDLINE
jgi:hypothetical protein